MGFQKGFIHIWIILALVVVGVGSVAFFATKSKDKPLIVKEASKPVAIVSPTPNPDFAASWKTYTNNEYGFSFKYPAKLQLESLNEETLLFTLPAVNINSLIDPATVADSTDKPFDGIKIVIIENVGGIAFEKFIENEKDSFDSSFRPEEYSGDDAIDYEIGGQTGVLLETDSSRSLLYIPVPGSDTIIVLRLSVWTSGFEAELTQIFSTFEFTN